MIPYRSDIDGLRAISIIAVVAYHADYPFAAGGFVGVDVFFVISGYLITSLLARELGACGRIDLVRFWGRRIRRLLPSAFIATSVSAVLAIQILPPYDLKTAGGDLVAASAYIVNWSLALRAVEYLAEGERHSLYLHLWSLSVEEQFYVIWPIVMVGVASLAGVPKLPRAGTTPRALAATVIVAGLCSLLFCLWLTAYNQPLAFFGTSSRAWQLLAGALIALLPGLAVGPTAQRVLVWLGATLIAQAVLFYSKDTSYPGFAAIGPVCGAALIILAGHNQTPRTASWLSLPSLVFIGRISYALYLWHWPILLLGDAYLGGATGLGRALLIGISFVLASLTYTMVEQPIRHAKPLIQSPVRSILLGFCMMGAGATIGYFLSSVQGRETITLASGLVIDPEKVRQDIPELYRDGCHHDRLATEFAPCVYGNPTASQTVVLFGDSHAAQWFPAIEAAARDRGWRLVSRTRNACPSIDIRLWTNRLKREYSECAEWRTAVVAEIANLNPDLVILANQSGYKPMVGTGIPSPDGQLKALQEGEVSLVERIRKATRARVISIRDTPTLPEDPLDCLFRRRKTADRCGWARDLVLRAQTYPLASYAAMPRVSVVDMSDLICGPEFCPALKDGLIVMRDRHHLTATFAHSLAGTFGRMLEETARTVDR